MDKRMCAADGCDRSDITGRDLCGKHYQQWRSATARGTCGVAGCDENVNARGLCKKHYMEDRTERLRVASCAIGDCGRPRSAADGLCVPHHQRRVDYGDPLAGPPLRKQRGEGPRTGTTSEYHVNHVRVRKARGPAWRQRCAHCGEQASHWATIHGQSGESPDDYMPLCRSCHHKYDGLVGNLANRRTEHSPETRMKIAQAHASRSPEAKAATREKLRQAALLREARKRAERDLPD